MDRRRGKPPKWKVEHVPVQGAPEEAGTNPGSVRKIRRCLFCARLALHGVGTHENALFHYQVNRPDEVDASGAPRPGSAAASEMSKSASAHGKRHHAQHERYRQNREQFDADPREPDAALVERIAGDAEQRYQERGEKVEGLARRLVAEEALGAAERDALQLAVMRRLHPAHTAEHYHHAALAAREANRLFHAPKVMYEISKRQIQDESEDESDDELVRRYSSVFGVGTLLAPHLGEMAYTIAGTDRFGQYEWYCRLASLVATSAYQIASPLKDTTHAILARKRPRLEDSSVIPMARIEPVLAALSIRRQEDVDALCLALGIDGVTLTTTTTTTTRIELHASHSQQGPSRRETVTSVTQTTAELWGPQWRATVRCNGQPLRISDEEVCQLRHVGHEVVELCSPVLRMFAILTVRASEVLEVARTAQRVVASFFEGTPHECVVSCTRPRRVEGGEECVLRLNFPDVLVTQSTALTIRESLVAEARVARVEKECYLDGAAVVGSRRRTSCCDSECAECAPFVVRGVVSPAGEWDADGRARTSIRTPVGTPPTPVRRPAYAPSYAIGAFVDGRSQNWERRYARASEAVTAVIKELINKRMRGCMYRETQLDRVYSTGRSYLATVHGKGSSYCINIQQDHRCNRIYFEVTPAGIAQRCFAQKRHRATVHGRCSDWRTQRQGLSSEHQRLLFPWFTPNRRP